MTGPDNSPRGRGVGAASLGWVVCLSLTACSANDDGADRLKHYLTQLARAADSELPAAPPLELPRLSEAKLHALPINTESVSALDFLALSGCELQVNLGRRNSSLGRNASASQRLLLDLELLRLAPQCVEQLGAQGNAPLAEQLRGIVASRKSVLPKRIYNALLAGPEYRHFWQLPPRLQDYPASASDDIVDALSALEHMIERWLGGDYQANNGQLEEQLSVLRAGDGGALLLASATVARALYPASGVLEKQQAVLNGCTNENMTAVASMIQAVVSKLFTRELQPWLAQLDRREVAVMTPLRRIETHLSAVLPANYQAWQSPRDTLLGTVRRAPKAHANAIQTTLKRCAARSSSPASTQG